MLLKKKPLANKPAHISTGFFRRHAPRNFHNLHGGEFKLLVTQLPFKVLAWEVGDPGESIVFLPEKNIAFTLKLSGMQCPHFAYRIEHEYYVHDVIIALWGGQIKLLRK